MRLLSAWFQHFPSTLQKWQRKAIAYFLLATLGVSIAITPVQSQSPVPNAGVENPEKTEYWWQESQRLYEQKNYDGAIAVLQNQIAEFTTIRDILGAARANIYLSLVHQKKGEWEAAENALAQSSTLLNELGIERHPPTSALFLEVRGGLYFTLGQADKAFKDWEQAAKFYRDIKQEEAVLRCQIHQSNALKELGQHRAAIELLSTLLEKVLSLNFQNTDLKISFLQNLASMVGAIGNRSELESALSAYLPKLEGDKKRTEIEIANGLLTECLTLARQLNSPQAIAETYLKLGELQYIAYRRTKDAFERAPTQENELKIQNQFKESAIAYFQAARGNTFPPFAQIQAYLNLLKFFVDLEKRPESELNPAQTQQRLNAILQEVEEMRSRLSTLPLQSQTLQARIHLATSLMEKDCDRYFSTIESLLLEVKESAESLNDTRIKAYAWGYLGKLYQTRSQFALAFDFTQKAISYAEEARADEVLYEWEWQQGKLYAAQNNLKDAAIAYEETIKTLDNVRYDLLSLKNPDVNFTFRDNVEPVYREYLELLFRETERIKAQESQYKSVQANLSKARTTLEKLQLAELEDYLRCRVTKNQTLSLDSAIETKHLNAATIHVTVLDDRLDLIVKLPQKSELLYYPVKQDRKSLAETIVQAKEEFSDNVNKRDYMGLKNLYEMLFKPIKNILKSSAIETLVFVLDNPLTGIPMSALYDGEKFLIENYSVASNLGLDYPESEPFVPENSSIIIAGISLKNQDSSALAGAGKFMDLMQAKSEWGIQFLRDEAFTGEALKTALEKRNFSLVHLVTHGQYSSSPEETFLFAWKEEKLDLFRLAGYLKNRADSIKLLVLDACKTAVGDRRTVLGIAGVSMQAGARSTVASVANVPDDSAPLLMEVFYRELNQPNVTKAEALRRAQIALWKINPEYKQPRHWSPYVLIGNWS